MDERRESSRWMANMRGPAAVRGLSRCVSLCVPLLFLVGAGCGPELPLPEGADALDRQIVELLEAERVPGASVALVRGGELLLERAYGYADPDSGRLNEIHTRFLVASVSKLVTGIAVMQLVEAGTLDLDEPIDTQLSFQLAHPGSSEAITARQLLTHTAGLRDNWDVVEPLYSRGDSDLALEAFLRGYLVPGGAYYDAGANFVGGGPGDRFEYSNVGFALVAHLLEEVEGQDFAAYSRTAIFEPLGMLRTSWTLDGIPEEELAVPTTWSRGFHTHAHYGFPDYPSGSLRTTAGDLAVLAQAVLEPTGVPLAPASVAAMWEVALPDLEPTQGLAFYRWQLDSELVIGHNGGELGATAELAIRPERDDLVIVLVNGEMEPGGIAAIERALFSFH